ncbi:MAG: hypothetical protein FWJ93_14280 [Micromonosporaceae bacterium]
MSTKKYPTPLYAVAGAGDYAYEQLRKLPAKLTELRGRIAASDLDVRGDLGRLRGDFERLGELARRNARAVLDEARTVYTTLVQRGAQVVDRPADELAEIPAADVVQAAEAVAADAAGAEAVSDAEATADGEAQAKPAKRTRRKADS